MKKENWIIIGLLTLYIMASLAITTKSKEIKIELDECRTEIAVTKDYIRKMDIKIEELSYAIETLELEKIEVKEEVKVEANHINYDYNYVLRVVTTESIGEPLEGQMAVAQCIYETARATGQTPEQVVKQPNQYAGPSSMSAVTDSVREACERVFLFNEKVTEEPIRYFYSTANGFYSRWHESSLDYVMTIGNHKFFKAKG